MAAFANDQGGAFDYLHGTAGALLKPSLSSSWSPSSTSSSFLSPRMDVEGWLRRVADRRDVEEGAHDDNDGGDGRMAVDSSYAAADAEEVEDVEVDDAVSICYASVTREVLSATLSAFPPSAVLSGTGNLGTLSDLTASVYRNSPALCGRFWSDWDSYCSYRASLSAGPMKTTTAAVDPACHLLDAAYALASEALSSSSPSSPSSGSPTATGRGGGEPASVGPPAVPLPPPPPSVVPRTDSGRRRTRRRVGVVVVDPD